MSYTGIRLGTSAAASCFLLTIILATAVTKVWGSTFRHLGCYDITSATRGVRYNYGVLKLDQCATGCNEDGYPFLTLREGTDCICVNEYGSGGKAAYGARCNYTCRTDDFNFLCGGIKHEDVYYAVDTDKRTVLPLRDNILNNEPDTYENARMACVRQNGDLPLIVNQEHINAVWTVAKNSNYSGVWIGAYRVPWGGGRFDWGGLNLPDQSSLLDISAGSSYWTAGNSYSGSGECVILLRSEIKLQVVDCEDRYPHICLQIPPTETTTEGDTTLNPEVSTEAASGNEWAVDPWLLFWICFPIFLVLFLGSCLIYTIYHIYKLCYDYKRRKAYEKDLDNDSKPFVEMEASNRPRTVSDIEVDNKGYSRTPIQKVRLERDAYCMTPPPAPVMTSDANIKSQYEMNQMIPPDEQDIDFTKLSINDIMYIKMIVGAERKQKKEHTKKKKKVLST